jgi:hypothetical protein
MLKGPGHRYTPVNKSGGLVNINAFIEVSLHKSAAPAAELRFNSFRRTSIHIMPGDMVNVEAEGSIELGMWVRTSSPEGRESGVGGVSLAPYNLVRTINHGALMNRIAHDADWKCAGKHVKFIAGREGELEFEVNDKQQYDNRGSYLVNVVVEK